MNEPIGQLLRGFLTAQLPGADLEVVDLERIGVGRSRQNWVFDLIVSHDGTTTREPLILRRDPDGGLVDTERSTEFAVLQALAPSALPTPRPRWLDPAGDWLGKPSLIMGREPGVCDYLILNGELPEKARLNLARELCGLLTRVHEVDWRGLGLAEILADPGPNGAAVELSNWERVLRQNQLEAYPELELALDWLGARAPTSQRTVLVHADFKPGNVLMQDGHIVALLDWELAHLGDPLEDLGWVTQPLRAREHLIPGRWERADLLREYTKLTGLEIEPSSLAWWATFSTFKIVVMQVSGLRSFIEGRSDEPYRPTRRVLRTLLDAVTVKGE